LLLVTGLLKKNFFYSYICKDARNVFKETATGDVRQSEQEVLLGLDGNNIACEKGATRSHTNGTQGLT